MHQELGSGPHHCSSVALIYYPVCLYSYLWPCTASPSIKHTQTHSGWHVHMSAHRLLAPCFYGHWDTCGVTVHTLHEPSHTYSISTLTYSMLPQQHTLTCVVQRVNSLMLLFHASLSHRHHCLFFSSISFCILIFIPQTLSLSHKSPRGQEHSSDQIFTHQYQSICIIL